MGFRKSRNEPHKTWREFEEAQSVFGDPLARIFDDDVHSFDEKRNAIFGHSIAEPTLDRKLYRAGR